MTRSKAKKYLEEIKNNYDTEDEDDEEFIDAIDFALTDMDSLQDILYITDGISVD